MSQQAHESGNVTPIDNRGPGNTVQPLNDNSSNSQRLIMQPLADNSWV